MPIEKAPARNGNSPVLNDGEEIKYAEPRTRLFADGALQGEGTLSLTNQRVVWLADSNVGYAIDYPFIPVNGLSRGTPEWPMPCLYCQLKAEEKERLPDASEDEGEEPHIPELRFVPSEVSHLQQIFKVFSEMSALNPDPNEEDPISSDDEDDDEEDDQQKTPAAMGAIWVADNNDDAMEDADDDDEDDTDAMMS